MQRFATMMSLLGLVVTASVAAQAAEPYTVDTNHSQVGFKVKHMAVATVRGQFTAFTVELMVDEADITNSSVVLRIDADSIDTNNERRDSHLRSADFLEVETYPEIVFESKRLDKQPDGTYKATGDLTIKDVTKEVVLDLEINGPIQDPWGNNRVGADGGLTINRQDFNVKWDSVMDNGGLVAANDVKIEFALEATRKLE
jgi:polyisoprenoid-binding protein YceI